MEKLFTQELVVSVCGTFLKPAMQSVYRQIARLERYRTVVFTEKRMDAEMFPLRTGCDRRSVQAAAGAKLEEVFARASLVLARSQSLLDRLVEACRLIAKKGPDMNGTNLSASVSK